MNLSNKWLCVLLCIIVLNLFVVLKIKDVSAQVELDQAPCPSTLLHAVLQKDIDLIEWLLKQGVDPNASLENCQIAVTDDAVIVLLNENQQLIDAWRISSRDALLLDNMPDSSSLLHIAARLCRNGSSWVPRDQRIHDLLVRHGANPSAMDAAGHTSRDVLRRSCR